jgi:O-antigen/teichoic acid export membrane protein
MTVGFVREFVRHNLADPLYRQSLYMLASAAVAAATGLLFWVVAAHRQRPEVLGVAAGLIAANAFLSYLTSFALPYAMLRFGSASRPVSAMLNLSVVVSAASSLLAAGCYALVAPLTSPALADQLRQPTTVALFGLAGVGVAIAVLLDNLLAARRRGAVVLARNTAAGLLRLAPLGSVGSEDARGLFLAATMPTLVTAVAVLAVLPRLIAGYRWRDVALTAQVREVAHFAARAFPASLLSGAPQFALPLIAVSVLAAGQYAFFYIAWSIAQILYLVPSVIANISLSEGAATVARARRFSLLLLAPAAIAGVALAGPVLEMYGAAYVRGAVQPLRLMLLAGLPWTIVIMAQSQLRAEHRFRALTLVTGVFCVVSLTVPVVAGVAGGVRAMAAGWFGAVAATALLAWRQTAVPA